MGFKYTHRVYNDVHDTSATEQQVLAVLAHFADDKTGFCFPSQGTLARQSHLHPATIKRRLNSLKKKGYLEWIPGGRKINGRSVSNLYRLRLPKPQPKREEMQLAEFWETVDNSKSSGAQCATPPAHSAPPTQRTVRPLPGAQCATIIYRTSKDHPDDHNPPDAGEDMPGRFELGVARRNGTLGDVLEKITAAAQETKRCEQKSVVQMAMDAACTEKLDDRKIFSTTMLTRNPDDCRELLWGQTPSC